MNRSNRRRAHALSLLVVALSPACSNHDDSGDCPTSSVTAAVVTPELAQVDATPLERDAGSPTTVDEAVSANNAFTVALYGELRKSAGTANLVTSPLSAWLALGMTYAGAVGPTATEMAAALHVGGDPDAVAAGQGALSRLLAGRGASARAAAKEAGKCSSPIAYQSQIVNSIWGERTYPWERPFLETLARDYGTGVALEDFIGAPGTARQTINAWVSAETNGTINNLLPADSIDATTRMVLVNAIHLKLPWAIAFDPGRTAPAPFTKADGSTVTTPFMKLEGTFPYTDDGTAQIVALPLSGEQVSIVVSVPHQGVDLATYEATLKADSPALTIPELSTDVRLALPRVGFASEAFSLATALGNMGMHLAFDRDQADFSGICSSPPDGGRLSIHDVLQKAMVEMKETGVEAAAATAVVSCNCAATFGEFVTVDRPYLVSIVDAPTGAILFLGHIEDPTDSGSP